MNRRKQNTIIFSLFIVLFIVALAPFLLTKLNNNTMIDAPIVMDIPMETSTKEQKAGKDQTLERIQIIEDAHIEDTGVITERQQVKLNRQEQLELISNIEKQILELQEKNVLPSFNMQDIPKFSFIDKRTFMNSKNQNVAVSIWDAVIEYEDVAVGFYMDTETNVIYKVALNPQKEDYTYDESQISPKAFLEYLNIDGGHASQKEYDIGDGYLFYGKDDFFVDIYYVNFKNYIRYEILFE